MLICDGSKNRDLVFVAHAVENLFVLMRPLSGVYAGVIPQQSCVDKSLLS